MPPILSASGSYEPPILVFRMESLPFRTKKRNGEPLIETNADLLLRGDSVDIRDEVDGVDSGNFLNWAKLFSDSVSDLISGGHMLLLVLESYMDSHVDFRA